MNDNLTISIIREHMRKLGQKGGKRAGETMSAEARRRRSAKGGRAGKGSAKPRNRLPLPKPLR